MAKSTAPGFLSGANGNSKMNQHYRPNGKIASWIVSLALLLGGGVCLAQNTAPPDTGETELADRFESIALNITTRTPPTPVNLRSADVLLRAAAKLNPAEPHLARELAEVRLNRNDYLGAEEALRSYLTILPDDQYAQTTLIDLYVRNMQTADTILAYLHKLIPETQLAAPVRAYAAVKCAEILLNRSQKDQAIKMVDAALHIEPLNNLALHLKYSLTGATDGASRRVGLLLAMLKSNPMDPAAAVALGQELAAQGLPAESAQAYVMAFSLYRIANKPLPPELAIGGAIELYLAGRTDDAITLIDSMLANIPGESDGWMVRLAIAQDTRTSTKVSVSSVDSLCSQAVLGLTNHLQQLRSDAQMPNSDQLPAAQPPDTTQPSDITLIGPTTVPVAQPPDLSNDMPILVKANNPRLTDSYVEAVADLAWMRLYFLHDSGADTQSLLTELQKMLPANDSQLACLLGWSLLDQGKFDDARKMLSPIASESTFAAIGMILLNDQAGDKQDADKLAHSELASHPSGAIAAMLYSKMRGRGATVVPLNQSDAVKAEVDAFPKDWLQIVSQPQEFYSISVEPVTQQVGFGQAILARVIVRNNSNYDLTIGEDGALKPEIIFDAAVHGIIERQLTSVITDQFWRRTLLPPGQQASQIVRMDMLGISDSLNLQPQAPEEVEFAVTSNPVPYKQSVAIGGCGYRSAYSDSVERTATPLDAPEDRKQLYDLLGSSSSGDRFCAAERLITFSHIKQVEAEGPSADALLAVAKELLDHAAPAAKDTDPAVRGWAQYMTALVSSADQQPDMVRQMAMSDDWFTRLLSLLDAHRLLPDKGQAAAEAMTTDKEPIVKDYAQVVLDQIAEEAAAATQPAAQ
jgi:tetratricopeptide (TPR) repeat protein